MANRTRRQFLTQTAAMSGGAVAITAASRLPWSRADGADITGTATGQGGDAGTALIYGAPEYFAQPRPTEPIALGAGPHLFLDEHLIASSDNVTRTVNSPQRDKRIPNPLITGKEDRCFQPFFTVSRAPETGKFRVWYGVWPDGDSLIRSHIAYMESDDGVHWKRPTRILRDPAPIQFGSEVIDDGPYCAEPTKRYKYSWWYDGGTRIAVSPNGIDFTPISPDCLIKHNHDITGIWFDPLRKHYVATISQYLRLPHMNEPRRTTYQAVSADLLHWSPVRPVLVSDARYDKDVLQFYAMNGYVARGGLVIGMVKNLHDDWHAAGHPAKAYGIGSTSLAWTHDGRTWIRDRDVFFGPDPQPGAWDHAHAWIDEQVPLGNTVYLYYAGYMWGHKEDRRAHRQIGLVTLPRDRYVARAAGAATGTLRTPLVTLNAPAMTVNADIAGELRVRATDAAGKPRPGFDWVTLHGDNLSHPVRFPGDLAGLAGQPLRLEFQLRNARLFGFELAK